MHDPLVVAFDVKVPIPRRARWHDARPSDPARWRLRRRRYSNRTDTSPYAGKPMHPWWRPGGWEVRLAGRAYAWRTVVTVWHREPGGADSGDVCPHVVRWQDEAGRWHMRPLNGWRFHVRHWHLQFPPLQALRRRLLTRCAWCGGPSSRRRGAVNCSLQWDGPRGRWWRGEPALFHSGCSSMPTAHRRCVCAAPLAYRDGDPCLDCGKRWWPFRDGPNDDADTIRRKYARLATLPKGTRPPRWEDIPIEEPGRVTPEECVAAGGHCFERTGMVLTSSPPQYPERCRHCPASRVAVPREPFEYRYPPGQP